MNKQRARDLANLAQRKGVLIPQPCADCGAPADQTQKHHEDYDRPLDVIWLCSKCHGVRHREADPGICSKCKTEKVRGQGQRYCKKCHSEAARRSRAKLRDLVLELELKVAMMEQGSTRNT